MDNGLRSIPITILDFMAIFLPGTLWLVLMITTFQFLFEDMRATPITALKFMMLFKDSWSSTLPLIIGSVLIGYILHSVGMTFIEYLYKPILLLHKDTRHKWKSLKFPFNELYEEEKYYKKIKDIIKEKIGISPDNLPANQPFSTAKRFLRMMYPSLWEESLRFEAGVRMIGYIFLASIYSLMLSFLVIIKYKNIFDFIWAIISIIAILILAEGFKKIREEEVKYTYLNFLIAFKLN